MNTHSYTIAYRRLLLLFVVASALLLSSCDSALEEEPESSLAPGQFYRNAGDAVAAVDAAYAALATNLYYDRPIHMLNNHTSDVTNPRGGSPNFALDNLQHGATNRWVNWVWEGAYTAVNRSNVVLAAVPPIDMDEELKARVLAEARFLRALNYFNLVRLWGPVPLQTEPTGGASGANLPRTSVDSVYQLVIGDLQTAEENLPSSYSGGDVGRATSGAATSLLAKVYLTRENWSTAAQKAKEVINSGEYRLLDDYAAIFDIDNENNAEHIFQVQFLSQGPGTLMPRMVNPRGSTIWSNQGAWAAMRVERPFYETYRDDDYRKDVGYITEYTDESGDTVQLDNVLTTKYRDPNGSPSHGNNMTVLRYADVLLMYAEAAIQSSGGPTPAAYDAINQVRSRAKLPDLPSGLSQQEFREAVIRERKWELALEFNRWFDLVRTETMVETLANPPYNKDADPYERLFPIPQSEIDANSAISQEDQNSGY